MTGDTTLTISVLVLLIGVALNIIGFYNNRKKDIKTDTKELYDMRESLVKLNMKSDQICLSLNEMRVEVRSITERVGEIEKEVTTLKFRLNEAFDKIKELKGAGINE